MAAVLQCRESVELASLLERCRAFEERAAAAYHRFAAGAGATPESRALWTRLAGEEEAHARAITLALRDLEPTSGWRTTVDGWNETIEDIDRRLAQAEALPADASLDQRLAAALDIEASELEALRRVVVAASTRSLPTDLSDEHASRLATEATALSNDPDVGLRAAVVRARALLTSWDAAHERRDG